MNKQILLEGFQRALRDNDVRWPIGCRGGAASQVHDVALPRKPDQEWMDQPNGDPRKSELAGFLPSGPLTCHKSHVPCARAWLPRSPSAELLAVLLLSGKETGSTRWERAWPKPGRLDCRPNR